MKTKDRSHSCDDILTIILNQPLEVREQKNGKSPKVSSLLFLVVDKVVKCMHADIFNGL